MVIQTKRERARFSRLCQELRQHVGQIFRLSQTLLSDKPLMRGTLYELRRKCGKPACKRSAGHLHSTMVVVSSEGGLKKLRVVAKGGLSGGQLQVPIKYFFQTTYIFLTTRPESV